jgi:DNA (cytosine-5)-methyltransferase 1
VRYLSVCSGIEAATVAWHPLGWVAAAYSEIEAFPRAVLTHHYPTVPLHGDFTTIRGNEYGPIDLLVGGTPCQDFSVAGLRTGIAGDRGNLTLEFLRLASRTEPRWIVWENVPGVLSSDGGRALGAFLGGLAELGYGFAYRVLDAQHFGLAQRRARVFVVGYLGDWRRAAAVLFERESLQGHPAPSREAGKGTAPTLSARTKGGGGLGTDFDCDGGLIADSWALDLENLGDGGNIGYRDCADASITLNTNGNIGIAHSLRAEGFDASEDGTGRGTPLVTAFEWQRGATQRLDMLEEMSPALIKSQTPAIAFSAKDHGADAGPLSPTLRSGSHDKSHANGGVMPAVAYSVDMGANKGLNGGGILRDMSQPLGTNEAHAVAYAIQERAVSVQGRPSVSVVRRLTPEECEALQGFPRGYTNVTYRGKPAADGPRYKALGNSMAVPVMGWIGRRIEMVESIAAFSSSTAPAVLASTASHPQPNRPGEG